MAFEIMAFTSRLKDLFLSSPLFPMFHDPYITKNGRVQTDREKHPKREPLHLYDAIDNSIKNSMLQTEGMVTFDIGNEQMERVHPYYHILEDSPYIRKQFKGTTKTKGSQARIENLGQRDYGLVTWNGKTFTKEYQRNIRGKRNRIGKVSHWATDYNGDMYFINRDSNSYLNVHYRYIERILDSGILDILASEQGLKLAKRKIDTGLKEEYFSQLNDQIDILDIMSSFD